MTLVKRDLIIRFCVACMLAVSVISCQVGHPTVEQDSHALWRRQPDTQIVFMSRADAPEGELYLLDKSGQTTRLTHNSRHENTPALSFDGERVAFTGGDEGNPLTWEIYVLDLVTGKESRLTDNGVIDAHPDWSPDDSLIVFGSFRDTGENPSGTADIYVSSSHGTGAATQLSASPWEDNDPEWSPDGTRIVFKSTRGTRQNGREEIYVMRSDGTLPQRLTTTSGWQSDHDPSWSPDGERVVFTRFEGSRAWFDTADFAADWEKLTPWNVHRVDLDGNLERLTSSSTAGWGVVAFSGDGSQILFGTIDWITDQTNRVIGGHHRLTLMDADGTNQRQLLPDDRHTGTLEFFDW